MLEFVIYFLIMCGIIYLGITIAEKIKQQREEDELERQACDALIEARRLEREADAEREREYVQREAKKFSDAHPCSIPTRHTLESPPKRTFGAPRTVPGQTIKVSERKLVRDHYVADTYCEPDCVPLISPLDVLAAEVIIDAVTHRPDYFDGGAMVSSYNGGGGQFDGGGAQASYSAPEPERQTYTAPEPDPPSYSEPDSSSSWGSDDD